MRGTVVFDFDDTLADTVSFKAALSDAPQAGRVVERMAEFIAPGAESLLRRLKAEGWKLALLTFGDRAWQEAKVMRSGLLPFFDHVVYTAEPKETRIADFSGWSRPLVFVNDHGGEIDALSAALPEARMIAVRGRKPAPLDPAVPICASLEEVYKTLARV